MRARGPVVVAALAALIAAVPAHAATKTLDGKRTKTLTFKDLISAPQDHDTDTVSTADRTVCSEPRCSKFTFLYKPAKGVKRGAFSVRIAWTYPVEDFDLYVVQDNGGAVAQCGAGAGTSEVAVVPQPLPGHRYTVVVDHYRALPDTVTATVTFPAKNRVATTVPAAADDKVEPINCGIS
jgi:hypothetical protein